MTPIKGSVNPDPEQLYLFIPRSTWRKAQPAQENAAQFPNNYTGTGARSPGPRYPEQLLMSLEKYPRKTAKTRARRPRRPRRGPGSIIQSRTISTKARERSPIPPH